MEILMNIDSHFDLLDIKKATEVVKTSKMSKGQVFLTSY